MTTLTLVLSSDWPDPQREACWLLHDAGGRLVDRGHGPPSQWPNPRNRTSASTTSDDDALPKLSCTLLLAGTKLAIHPARLPTGASGRQPAVLASVLEDRLLEESERLVYAADAAGEQVAVIRHSRLSALLARLAGLGLQVASAWPLQFALPAQAAVQALAIDNEQGVLRMRGQARIENALTGVLLAKGSNADPLGPIIKESTGGYINATDAKFLNNRYDVVFRPFENRQDGTTTVLSNRSSFVRCSFRTLGDLNDPWLYPKDHVAMVLNRGIRFHGCDFSNAILGSTYDLPFEQGTGIHSMNSRFIVGNDCNVILPYGAPCPPANTTSSAFTNLHRGILATTFDPSRTFSVSDATFTGTNYAIRMEGIQDAAIHRNAFEVPEPITPGIVGAVYGVYSDQCTGYSIQENAFLTTISATIISPRKAPGRQRATAPSPKPSEFPAKHPPSTRSSRTAGRPVRASTSSANEEANDGNG